MAHCLCINGYDMWNGDGKPEINAFSISFFEEFMEAHPGVFLVGTDYPGIDYKAPDIFEYIYDCYDWAPSREPDCWLCEDCESLTVFFDDDNYRLDHRYDFVKMEKLYEPGDKGFDDWEEYVAMRNDELDEFGDWYIGLDPLTALKTYPFKYRYKVSPDQKYICAFDSSQNLVFSYEQVRFLDFQKEEKRTVNE